MSALKLIVKKIRGLYIKKISHDIVLLGDPSPELNAISNIFAQMNIPFKTISLVAPLDESQHKSQTMPPESTQKKQRFFIYSGQLAFDKKNQVTLSAKSERIFQNLQQTYSPANITYLFSDTKLLEAFNQLPIILNQNNSDTNITSQDILLNAGLDTFKTATLSQDRPHYDRRHFLSLGGIAGSFVLYFSFPLTATAIPGYKDSKFLKALLKAIQKRHPKSFAPGAK